MAQLTDLQIAQFAANAGWSGNDLNTAVAVAIAESRGISTQLGDVNLQNATYGPSVGLWQIRSVNPGYGNAFDQAHRNAQANLDPSTNASDAYAIQQNPLGHGWNEWSTYSHGDYRQYLDRARAATSQLNQGTNPATPTDPAQQPATPPSTQTPSTSPTSSPSSGQSGSQDFMGELEKLIEAITKLKNPAATLNKASQNARGAAASSSAFGKVSGSSTAHAKHVSNTQACSDHASRGSQRVTTQGSDIQNSANSYDSFSQQGASDLNQTGSQLHFDDMVPSLPGNLA